MAIKTIAVIGAGQMGNGIAQVAAQAGYAVIMNDIADEFVQRGMQAITKNLTKKVEKGKMAAEDKDAILRGEVGLDHDYVQSHIETVSAAFGEPIDRPTLDFYTNEYLPEK